MIKKHPVHSTVTYRREIRAKKLETTPLTRLTPKGHLSFVVSSIYRVAREAYNKDLKRAASSEAAQDIAVPSGRP